MDVKKVNSKHRVDALGDQLASFIFKYRPIGMFEGCYPQSKSAKKVTPVRDITG